MKELTLAIEAAIGAGKKILEVYQQDFGVSFKEDESPLTSADLRANKYILGKIEPTGIPVISEEIRNLPYEKRTTWARCWVVDPLDGTKEFIKKNGEFTVNIALVEEGTPVLGVVYLPTKKRLYFASKEIGSYVIDLKDEDLSTQITSLKEKAKSLPLEKYPETFTIVSSRSHSSKETEAFIENCRSVHGSVKLISKGSSLKLCMVAEGKAQVYPRIAPTMEWDTAAAHAVAKYAGCRVINFETKEELVYNKRDLLNPHFMVLQPGLELGF